MFEVEAVEPWLQLQKINNFRLKTRMKERRQKLFTFLNIAFVNDLSTSLARLFNHESCAHSLVVATQTLTRLVPHLRHDFRRHCVAEEDKLEYDVTHSCM